MLSPVAAAEQLAPIVAASAEATEQARRIPAELAQKLATAGLLRLSVPRSLGGPEASAHDFLRVIEIIGQADASAGWFLMIGNTTALNAAYLPPDVARAIWAQPDVVLGGVFAPNGRAVVDGDHYRVTGRWSWASGSQNAHWLSGGCVVLRDGKPELLPNGAPNPRMVFFPADQAILHDTWFASGLQGTGSLDMEVRDIAVPMSHAVSLVTDRPRESGPLYAFPVFGLLAMGIAAVALGNARGAVDDFIALAGGKVPTGSRKTLAERPVVQAEIGKAEAELRAARAFLYEATAQAWARATAGAPLDAPLRASLRLAATHAAQVSARVVDICYTNGGGSAVYRRSSLQRRFRDAHVATQHMMVAGPTLELAGRVLLGLETDTSTL